MKAVRARGRTRPALGTPRDRGAGATRLPRWARPVPVAALALATLAAAGCKPYVEGNCVNASESRALSGPFQGVRVQDAIETTVTASAAQPKLVLSGDANLLPYVHAAVEPDAGRVPANVLRLWIEVPGGTFAPCIPPLAVLDAGELSSIGAEGDSHVNVSGLAAQTLSVSASGRSDVSIAGAGGTTIEIVADDATVDAGTYPVSGGAQVDLTSSARAEVHADGAVTGTAASGCTLSNFGAGSCAGVVAPAGAAITCPVH